MGFELTQAQARAMLFARHGFGVKTESPLALVDRLVAVQVQYASSLPVALACRGHKVHRNWDTEALLSGEVVKMWSVRSTLHAHSRDNYGLLLSAIGPLRAARHREFLRSTTGWSDADCDRNEALLLEAIRSGARNRVQIHERVPAYKNVDYVGWGLDLKGLASQGLISVHTPMKGATEFLPVMAPPLVPAEEAWEAIALRYFAAYAPATFQDFVYWSGLSVAAARKVVANVLPNLDSGRIEGLKGEYFLPRGDLDLVWPSAAPKLALLSKFDVLVLGHKDKSWILPLADHKRVFRIAGQVEAAIVENGVVAGTWRVLKSTPRTVEIGVEFHKPNGRVTDGLVKAFSGLSKTLGLGREGTLSVGLMPQK